MSARAPRALNGAQRTVFAAVIEWPDNHGRCPSLVLTATATERETATGGELQATADALTEPDWREAITDGGGDPFALEVLDEGPIITRYEEEV